MGWDARALVLSLFSYPHTLFPPPQPRAATYMLSMERDVPPLVKVSPEAQSRPNRAQISPASTLSTSSILSECMRTSLGTLTFFWSLVLKIKSPLDSLPARVRACGVRVHV